ncbi:MAG: SxtJ family membrane protein [Gammaproteobacteria bacterium]
MVSAAEPLVGHADPPPAASPRSFGIVFTVVFVLIGAWPLLAGGAPRYWSLLAGSAMLAVALMRPALLAPLSAAWQRFGLLLHRIVNPLVLGALFFLVVTPFGLLMRLFRPAVRAHLAARTPDASYWRPRAREAAVDGMRQQF